MHSYLLSYIFTLSVTCSWYSLYGFRYFWGEAFLPETKPKHNVPRYMWDIYAGGVNSSEVDVVKGLFPKNRGASIKSRSYRNHRKKEFEFGIPELNEHEELVKAEVRINGIKDAGVQIYTKNLKWVFLDEERTSDGRVALDVTTSMKKLEGRSIRFLILTLFREKNRTDVEILQPVLLLYGNESSRRKRSLEDFEEETNRIWKDEGFHSKKLSKRLKGSCRRKPLYIKFSDIDYDSWIVAPEGYEAFQCVGKCTFPVSENLSPTKHAILQTLLHNKSPSKAPTACCVPTKLEPISVLYIDAHGVLTYRFRYHDMVVAECGCR